MTEMQALFGAIGAILCVLVGHFLTRWSQRKQWLRDRKLEEYRELITSMANAIVNSQHLLASGQPLFGELDLNTIELQKTAMRTFADRIFIRQELDSMEILDEYMNAFLDLRNDRELGKYGPRMDKVMCKIIDAAQKI
ncbi:MAG: hypothetical protein ABR991_10510 [Terracidiphilus sp.]